MKFKKSLLFSFLIFALFSVSFLGNFRPFNLVFAETTSKYYTIYKYDNKSEILFLKGDDVSEGDMYLSGDNKLYEIVSVDDSKKVGYAKFIRDEQLPKYNISKASSNSGGLAKSSIARAITQKMVGIYHTHNDESYFTPDGVDSVYGKGGIHDVGKALSNNFNTLGIKTIYREDLHLPHNSGAYTRSQVTASEILNNGVDAIFDIHRDSTKRSEYLVSVDGDKLSSIRMVIGAASANFEENKKFAYSIKAYADEIYPKLIKDIYIGKGNYNQQLSTRAMLFEMGCENIEKEYVIKSTGYLAKVLDVVLYGSDNASKQSLADVSLNSGNGQSGVVAGLVSDTGTVVNSNTTLMITVSIIALAIIILAIVLIVSKNARYKVGRFFSEMFAGIFGKKAQK